MEVNYNLPLPWMEGLNIEYAKLFSNSEANEETSVVLTEVNFDFTDSTTTLIFKPKESSDAPRQ